MYDNPHNAPPHQSPHTAVHSQRTRVLALSLHMVKVHVKPAAVYATAAKVGPLQHVRHTFKERLRPAISAECCRVEGTVSLQRHVGGI